MGSLLQKSDRSPCSYFRRPACYWHLFAVLRPLVCILRYQLTTSTSNIKVAGTRSVEFKHQAVLFTSGTVCATWPCSISRIRSAETATSLTCVATRQSTEYSHLFQVISFSIFVKKTVDSLLLFPYHCIVCCDIVL